MEDREIVWRESWIVDVAKEETERGTNVLEKRECICMRPQRIDNAYVVDHNAHK